MAKGTPPHASLIHMVEGKHPPEHTRGRYFGRADGSDIARAPAAGDTDAFGKVCRVVLDQDGQGAVKGYGVGLFWESPEVGPIF